ncbi:MAG TPA: KpsF/GutQ family sugar-phosphate isomerase [Victivallales bacterium]|nr:KpsF/GutQ family sugar-phosphate isomerase [Victivallales bacterium]
MNSSYLDQAKKVFELEIQGLRKMQNSLDKDFESIVAKCLKILNNGGKIVVCGLGKSGRIGAKISATLTSTGSSSVFLHPVEAMHGDLGILNDSDLLLVLSYSGETNEILRLIPAVKKLNVLIVSITSNINSSLAKLSDYVIQSSIDKEACPFNIAPTVSTTVQLVIGDALAMILLNARGFSKGDFKKLHPGGTIGRTVTLRVTNIMRTGIALVKRVSTIRETVCRITETKCGSAIIVNEKGELEGIFTDGDLRRIIQDISILNKYVQDYMTLNPVTVFSDQLAIEALKLIKDKKIDDLIVIDRNNVVVGLVDSQDLPGLKLI